MELKERQPDVGMQNSRETDMTVGQVLNLLGTPEQVAHALSGYRKPKSYNPLPDTKLIL